ncbi:peptidylprolyl isomerase [Kurthia sibirica]|uniref:Foldase n=1 Tax=Kurthia sibirica TaxID=202750 RepID=A0A2U3AL89_9BACL|nr:peptidylprolyl isomerase [Kurthia sibirica]PWI25279.1 foldase [Kurthia sibirica]GEK35633.1 foldase protein PrsA 1 [Kurthia sibirica]
MKKKVAVIISLAVVIVVAGAIYFFTKKNSYIAKVGKVEITQEALNQALNTQYGAATATTLIQNEVIEQEATKQKVTATTKEIDAQVAIMATQYGGEEALEETLKSSNMTLADLKKNIKTYVKASKMITKTVDTSDQAIKAYYETNKDSFKTEAQVKASHILVAKKATATKVKKLLDEGGDFAKLAKKYSTDSANKQDGGNLGYFTASDMVDEFSTQAFALEKGDISKPIKTEYGYHIIKVTGKKVASTPTYAAVKTAVKAAYIDAQINEQYATWLTATTKKYNVKNTLETATSTEQ